MKERLLDERKSMLSKIQVDNSIVDFEGDEADEIQANLLVYVNNHVNSRYKSSIDKIDNALDKINKNTYGYCEECEEEIIEKRLEFNPYFITCVSCAEKKERNFKK